MAVVGAVSVVTGSPLHKTDEEVVLAAGANIGWSVAVVVVEAVVAAVVVGVGVEAVAVAVAVVVVVAGVGRRVYS